MMGKEVMNEMLPEMIRASVFLKIEALKEKGGPTKGDIEKAQKTSDMLGERGDVLIHGGGKKGERAELFNRTAHAIAVLAFVPGGVSLFGMHFEAQMPTDGGKENHDKEPV